VGNNCETFPVPLNMKKGEEQMDGYTETVLPSANRISPRRA
jgi:hypothetical protein